MVSEEDADGEDADEAAEQVGGQYIHGSAYDIHAHKPELCGRPLAYAYKRGQLADALQFKKSHEGFLHTTDKATRAWYSMLLPLLI
ncbi:hypothetical protein PG988_012766 [Apiospora saccharicola]